MPSSIFSAAVGSRGWLPSAEVQSKAQHRIDNAVEKYLRGFCTNRIQSLVQVMSAASGLRHAYGISSSYEAEEFLCIHGW